MHSKRFLLSVAFILAALACYAQGASVLSSAAQAYQQDSYEKAFSTIAEAIPETSADAALKRQAADALAGIGIQEYDGRNFKNAYESFRKALKYDPTNARATQYFLKMRKEMDTANLKNEGAPRTKPVVPETAAASAAVVSTTSATAVPAATQAAAAAPSGNDVALTELKAALEQADARLKSMESSVASTNQEKEQLRSQADQQLKLLQTFMATQAAQAEQAAKTAAAKPAASSAAAPQQSAAERALIAQTMALLAKMSDREAAPPQVVVQTDPELKSLVEKLDAQSKSQAGKDSLITVIMVLVGLTGAGILVFVFFFANAMQKSRKRAAANYQGRYEGEPAQFGGSQSGTYLSASKPSGETPLLEFIGSNSTAVGRPVDFDVRRDLLKADRLKRMYDEVRNGTLNWNTVREYIGELEVSLKAEILKIVEQKINEGDFISSEAVLPIIFPLVTDYDDFIREKSEKLAARAVAGTSSGNLIGASASGGESAADPLGVRALMEIPNALQILFKNQDQSLVTAKISRGIGNALGLSTDDCNLLYKAALAHDCGYLMLDRDVLQKTIGKPEITEEDFAFIQSHVIKGSTYFGDVELPEQFKAGLLYHHERNDGSGYPDGLKKDDIPQFGKIIGVSETFAALVSKRAYRDKRDIQHALAIITDGTRSKFDSVIVEALVKVASSIGRQ